MRCIGQVEIDDYCNKILEKHWPNVKRVRDIRDVKKDTFKAAKLICGGFPCQPFSQAGKRRGKEDNRYLWPEMLRVIKLYKPDWIIGENVTGILNMEFYSLLSSLESAGYDLPRDKEGKPIVFCIPACAVDAKHRRDRVWILAYSIDSSDRAERGQEGKESGLQEIDREAGSRGMLSGASSGEEILADTEELSIGAGLCKGKKRGERRGRSRDSSLPADVPYSEKKRLQRKWTAGEQESKAYGEEEISLCDSGEFAEWPAESRVCRVADGIPDRVHRLKALGNAIVPQIAEILGRAILKCESL